MRNLECHDIYRNVSGTKCNTGVPGSKDLKFCSRRGSVALVISYSGQIPVGTGHVVIQPCANHDLKTKRVRVVRTPYVGVLVRRTSKKEWAG
jgi:hypothetical protein